MIYREIAPNKRWPKPHSIELSLSERTYLFDKNGLLKREVLDWLIANVGKEGQMWNGFWYDSYWRNSGDPPAKVVFSKKDHALLFKLTWAPL
jgi:hypothetical protein